MSYSSVVNYFYSTWCDASNSIPNGTYGNISLLTFGNAELGRLSVKDTLGVGCNHPSGYLLDVSGGALIRDNLDVSGNVNLSPITNINSTWLDASLNLRALDSAVVKTSGDQTIGGAKTLTGALTSSQNITINSDTTREFKIQNTLNTTYCSITQGSMRFTGYIWGQSNGGDVYRGSTSGSTNFYVNNDEFSYLQGVSSNIQTQLNGKQATGTAVLLTGAQTVAGVKTFSSNAVFSGNVSITGDIISSWLDASLNLRALDSAVVKTSGTQSIAGNKTFSAAATFSAGATISGLTVSGNITGAAAIRISTSAFQVNGALHFPATDLYRKIILYPITANEYQNYSIGVNNTNLEQIYMVPDSTRTHTFSYGTSTTTKSDIAILKNDVSLFNSDLSCNGIFRAGEIQSAWLDASLNLRALDTAVVKTTGTQSIGGAKTFTVSTSFSAGLTSTGITLNGNLVNATSLRLGTTTFQVSGTVHFPATDQYRKIILYPSVNNEYQNYSIGVNNTNLEQVYMVPDSTRSHKFSYGTSTTTKSDIAIFKNDVSLFNSDLSCNALLKTKRVNVSDASFNIYGGDFNIYNASTEDRVNINPLASTAIFTSLTTTFRDCSLNFTDIIGINTIKINYEAIDISNAFLKIDNMYAYETNNTTLTTTTTITKPWYEIYAVESTSTAYTITLPTLVAQDLGKKILFRKVKQGGTGATISFIGNGTQKVYNTALTGGATAQALMPNATYIVELIALPDTTTGANIYGWFQI